MKKPQEAQEAQKRSALLLCLLCLLWFLPFSLFAATPVLVGKTVPGSIVRVVTGDGHVASEVTADKRGVFRIDVPQNFHLEIHHDGYPLEVVPHGNMIFFTNNDQPGVIGAIGSVLGRCSVNIAGMHLGREREGGKALALLLVDNPVDKNVIEQFRQVPNIISAKVVQV